jgi:hypothetical protein
VCCLGWRQLGCCPARLMRTALASTLARATVWRGGARMLPRVAAAEPSPCSLDAGCAGFYAGARHGVARGGTCAASGGGSWAVALLARRGLRWLLRWRVPRCGEWRHVAATGPSPCSLNAGCAGFYAGARHGVARGGTCAASGGNSWAVALLAQCGLRWLLRWRAPRCGERRHVCCLGWRQLGCCHARWRCGERRHVCCLGWWQLGRCHARSMRAALASTLARATVRGERRHVCTAASGGGS